MTVRRAELQFGLHYAGLSSRPPTNGHSSTVCASFAAVGWRGCTARRYPDPLPRAMCARSNPLATVVVEIAAERTAPHVAETIGRLASAPHWVSSPRATN